ncbi:molybdopterin converting factor small subunit MoeD [Acetobacter estunensis NRIC 0472]|uniref:Molybdopterin synthase sulfur carrier subunit n=1 Tax=Acetobacter estunensis TaxID=104097 RepID=A0A967B5T9_9PROT|nr:molybdopterin converting factor subunit 1 [Acetobacter estunensis]NHO54350.1 molybdopterin converting factor subunit 1 [Acetobacter estunensis]GBQ21876.1 molybdopterin converting factor small subunit MoeD [Acetobacter estunensis NRIC 0472]
MSADVTVLYFAALRERMGRSRDILTLSENTRTVGALLMERRKVDPTLDAALSGPGTLRVAVNRQLSDLSAPVQAGDEVAVFPPMTGG